MAPVRPGPRLRGRTSDDDPRPAAFERDFQAVVAGRGRSAVIAAAAESILLANDEAHGELLRAFRNLVDRLIARHGELRSTMAEIEADLAAARLGLMP